MTRRSGPVPPQWFAGPGGSPGGGEGAKDRRGAGRGQTRRRDTVACRDGGVGALGSRRGPLRLPGPPRPLTPGPGCRGGGPGKGRGLSRGSPTTMPREARAGPHEGEGERGRHRGRRICGGGGGGEPRWAPGLPAPAPRATHAPPRPPHGEGPRGPSSPIRSRPADRPPQGRTRRRGPRGS